MLIDFLKTERSKEELKIALEVIREFKKHESEMEWGLTPFDCWIKLEQLEEYLGHLAEGEELRDDTKEYIKRCENASR